MENIQTILISIDGKIFTLEPQYTRMGGVVLGNRLRCTNSVYFASNRFLVAFLLATTDGWKRPPAAAASAAADGLALSYFDSCFFFLARWLMASGIYLFLRVNIPAGGPSWGRPIAAKKDWNSWNLGFEFANNECIPRNQVLRRARFKIIAKEI